MSFQYVAKLPPPDDLREQFPMPAHLVEVKRERDIAIRDVITGKSNKFIVIIGPCSADNEEAVCDYVNRLARVNEKVKDKLI
ncbi:MAG: 3-deoxy-7-phosphoheptulonate synthase, partial [Lachnospiraceae bacterium]|nr:3-deoxy-7-phosphoheptulonate synthase [Lachnospiraceae bacterium]